MNADGRRWPAVVAVVVVALAAACGGGDDDAAGPPSVGSGSGSSSSSTSGPDEPGAGGGAATELDIEGSDVVTDLERRVSETLSELDAEQRGADTVVTLPEHVLFAFGRHELLPEATAVLDRLAEAMRLHGTAPVRVEGHTDAVGSDAANQALSERRAQAVVDHLVAAGIGADRLRAQGFGETRPVAPNTHPDGADDPAGRARNRRVEVVLEGVTAPG